MNKADSRGLTCLMALLMISHICVSLPQLLVAGFEFGVYIPVIITGIGAAGFFAFINRFYAGDCLNGFSGLPKGMSAAISIFLYFVFVLYGSSVMKEFSEAIGECILPRSPRIFILVVLAGIALAVCFTRIEILARYSLALIIVTVVFVSIIFAVTLSDCEPGNLFPVVGKTHGSGWGICLSLYADAGFFYTLKLCDKRSLHVPVRATFLATAVLAAVMFFYSLCVPFPASAFYEYPLHRLSLLANSSLIFQRLDGLVYIIWIFIAFVTTGAITIFATHVLTGGLNLKSSTAIAPATVFLCLMVSLADWNMAELSRWAMCIFTFVLTPVIMISSGRRKTVD